MATEIIYFPIWRTEYLIAEISFGLKVPEDSRVLHKRPSA